MESYIKKEYLDELGKAAVNIKLDSFSAALDPFSCGKQQSLSSELIDFIDKKIYPVPLKYALRLNIVGELSTEEKSRLTELIHEHYFLEVQDKKLDMKFLMIKIAALVLIGIAVLSFYFAVQNSWDMFTEILSVIGTFALWEAAYSIILEWREKRYSYLSAAQAAAAEIDFSKIMNNYAKNP